MNWYYAEGDQQRGPVADADLANLVKTGTVRPDTLVWREGMTDWQPYAEVTAAATPPADAPPAPAPPGATVPAAGGIVCSQCGNAFPLEDVIRYGELWVCARCKPAFVQRLKEGAVAPGTVVYGGFWIRFAAKFVDGLVMRFVGIVVGLLLGTALGAMGTGTGPEFMVFYYAVGFALDVAYKAVLVGAYGATLGKMALRLRVVNADGSTVGYGKALGRALAEYVSVLTLLIGYIIAGFDEEKRTLHDRICGTRVVKKQS